MQQKCLKAIAFVCVCSLTWACTTRIRAVVLPTHRPLPRFAGSKVVTDPLLRPIPVRNAKQPVVTDLHASLESYSVEVVNGQAVVAFETKLIEGEPDYVYLWVARIMTDDGLQELNQIGYDTQIFKPKLGVEVTPAFHDVLAIPRGQSRVLVSLYRFHQADENARGIINGSLDDAWKYSMLQGNQLVSVP